MTAEEFLQKVAAALDTPSELSTGQILEGVEGWDSLGILSILDLLEQQGVSVDIDDLRNAQTTDDLLKIASKVIG